MNTMLQSSMKFFNRKKDDASIHFAMLYIENTHLGIKDQIDLSELNHQSLDALVQFAEDLHYFQHIETPEDLEYVPYDDDEDEEFD